MRGRPVPAGPGDMSGPPERRPGRRIALVAALIAMGLSLLLLVQPVYPSGAQVPLEVCVLLCLLVALVAGRRRR